MILGKVWRKFSAAPKARLARSKKIRSEQDRSLYRSRHGVYYWLDAASYLQREIIDTGEFEPANARVMEKLVGLGDTVLDIGANIGYFTLLLSRLVGPSGRVVAFEPTRHYGDVLRRNLSENSVSNCQVEAFGLSSEEAELLVSIGDSSATLHWASPEEAPRMRETICLERLDDIASRLELERLDFIKIDVDGHEPFFFEGAWQTLERFRPRILLEVSAANYLQGGIFPAEFYDVLKSRGLFLYSEKDFVEYETKLDFLRECGNYDYSANVIACFEPLKAPFD